MENRIKEWENVSRDVWGKVKVESSNGWTMYTVKGDIGIYNVKSYFTCKHRTLYGDKIADAYDSWFDMFIILFNNMNEEDFKHKNRVLEHAEYYAEKLNELLKEQGLNVRMASNAKFTFENCGVWLLIDTIE